MLDVSRHVELFNPYNFNTPVHIIGVGATGSWVALFLAKLGIKDITIWDFDIVEAHNIANQFYSNIPLAGLSVPRDIGNPKTQCLQNNVYDMTRTTIKIENEKVTNQRLNGVIFLMVDTMEDRKTIWRNCIRLKPHIQHLIEPRMGLHVGRIYNINPVDLTQIEEYEKNFYDDKVAEVSACGASTSVISTAVGIASWCVRQLINWFNEEELDNEILIDFKNNNIITTRWC